MKFLAVALILLAFTQICYSAVISLEEGDDDNKRVFKMAMDPVDDPLPIPRFEYQNGVDADFVVYDLLGNLDCSLNGDTEVSMAIWDLATSSWTCTLTSALPNDAPVDDTENEEGLALECDFVNCVATWSRSAQAWGCSPSPPMLSHAVGASQDLCRSGDLLLLNLVFPANGLPAGLCEDPFLRQVGENAITTLPINKRSSLPRNPGDPDEAFYVQSTSKAIGEFGQGNTATQFGWEYWKWSPVRTTFPSGMGTFPPTYISDGHLVAVTSATYNYDGTVFSAQQYDITFRVVKITAGLEEFTTIDWSEDLTMDVTPKTWVTDNTGSPLSTGTIVSGEATSIRLVSADASLTGEPRDSYLAVSIWISTIQIEE